ncbi:MAG: type II toxin-antitoxin system VapC family toxin [Verrucomicrobia bacterium]|nr:type II toxin-antitoxin system VapC family toxin [Verrucomicrobiota bacterium]
MNAHIVDTNVLLFFVQNDSRLPKRAAAMIEDASRRSLVSIASLWEISIKAGIGKLSFEHANNPELPNLLLQLGFHLLAIEWQSIQRASALPWHHRDPFDRLIVAEALNLNAAILSIDSTFDRYGVERIGY